MSTQAPIEADHIVRCCNSERKSWKQWLDSRNAKYEKDFKERVDRWENGGWFYKLMFSHPEKYDSINDIGHHMNEIHYKDALDRLRDLEALANKSTDGVVMLSPKDARFLNIDDE
jgi:hypothetical protein